MTRDVKLLEPCLSAVFVDYDNIYLSLKRRNEDAAKRFAKDAGTWIKAIERGDIITPTNGPGIERQRRIVLNRCYGNPVPRRNTSDGSNSTDMSSFPFVRHHFLRAGFEIIDCPPLTAQLKNSSDIRMVMDLRDSLVHETRFEEFIILSGDADFTPVLHRLRAHARNTVVYANDYTAAPYTAISDGEIRESDLLRVLLDGRMPEVSTASVSAAERVPEAKAPAATPATAHAADNLDAARAEIVGVVLEGIAAASGPVPIESLADRAVRQLGSDRTTATNWAGSGSFRTFLSQNLPEGVQLTDQAPFFAYDTQRHGSPDAREDEPATPPRTPNRMVLPPNAAAVLKPTEAPAGKPAAPAKIAAAAKPTPEPVKAKPAAATAARTDATASSGIQQAVARIFDACQAPPLGPSEYRQLFELMAQELTENKLSGAQTITNVLQRALEAKLRVTRDDVRFVFDVVSEADPWFEQGATSALFAGRFRNFVVARCRSQGLSLSADDVDLIDRLFTGASAGAQRREIAHANGAAAADRWWPANGPKSNAPAPSLEDELTQGGLPADDMPRIVRSSSRVRG